ncbi:hypothetical protein H4R33_007076 [Dimargaris cristalligena]|nr:hypothetical protein H4R33_007076 [Dimargaris cristalligena]
MLDSTFKPYFTETDAESWEMKSEMYTIIEIEQSSTEQKSSQLTSSSTKKRMPAGIQPYWNALFYHETATNFATMDYDMHGKNKIAFAGAPDLYEKIDAVMLDTLTKRNVWLNFPILTLADRWPADKMAAFFNTLFRQTATSKLAETLSTNVSNDTQL